MIGCYVTWQTTIGALNMCLEYSRSIYRHKQHIALVRLDYQPLFGKWARTAGLVRILLLVNQSDSHPQIFVGHKLSQSSVQIATRGGRKAYERTPATIRIESFKIYRENLLTKMCSFFSQQDRENLNLWALERQITTKSQINLNIELKRRNSQANRSITFYKDSDTSILRSQAKLIFWIS